MSFLFFPPPLHGNSDLLNFSRGKLIILVKGMAEVSLLFFLNHRGKTRVTTRLFLMAGGDPFSWAPLWQWPQGGMHMAACMVTPVHC